jgi:hypothetical protein
MMPVSEISVQMFPTKWQECVKNIDREKEANACWSQTKKVVTVNKICNFTNPHLYITVHDFILAGKRQEKE